MRVTALTDSYDEHRYALAAALLFAWLPCCALITGCVLQSFCSEACTQFPGLAQNAEAYEHARSHNALAESVQPSERMLSTPGLKPLRTMMLLGRVWWETAMRSFSSTSQMKVNSVCHPDMPQGVFSVLPVFPTK